MTRIRLDYVHEFVDRHGKIRRYFRRRGQKRVRLPGIPGSEEFIAAYQTAMAAQPMATEIGASRTLPGTINALVVAYYVSDAWNNQLEEDTRKTRRRIIERFRVQHGDKRVALLQPEHIERMLSAIEKPSAKRHWLKAIRGLLRSAIPSMRRDDPTENIATPKLPKSKGHHTWTNDKIEKYRA